MELSQNQNVAKGITIMKAISSGSVTSIKVRLNINGKENPEAAFSLLSDALAQHEHLEKLALVVSVRIQKLFE